jgi:hypothetical protein
METPAMRYPKIMSSGKGRLRGAGGRLESTKTTAGIPSVVRAILLASLVLALPTIPAAHAVAQPYVYALTNGYCTSATSCTTPSISLPQGGTVFVVLQVPYGTLTVKDASGTSYYNDYTCCSLAGGGHTNEAVGIWALNGGAYSTSGITITTTGSAGTMAYEVFGVTAWFNYQSQGVTLCGPATGEPPCGSSQYNMHTQNTNWPSSASYWTIITAIYASPGSSLSTPGGAYWNGLYFGHYNELDASEWSQASSLECGSFCTTFSANDAVYYSDMIVLGIIFYS